jgi:hypothetical protein
LGHAFHDDGKRLYDRKVQRSFKNALEKASIENFTFMISDIPLPAI